MRTITDMAPVAKQPGRVAIEVDREPVAVVGVESVRDLRLAVGCKLDAEALEALIRADGRRRTLDRAIGLLAVRARSIRELRRRLLRAREPEEHVDAAIERLVAGGALDDEDYSRQLARSQMLGRGYAPRRLQQELARRGVARDVADRAIESVLAEDTPSEGTGETSEGRALETIERLARRKLNTLHDLDGASRSRRLYAFLARRGYDSDVIRGVMTKVCSEQESGSHSA